MQSRLDGILRNLRTIREDDAHIFGGPGGKGVKDSRSETPYSGIVNTAAAFEDSQFSFPHRGSSTYVQFLRSFLSEPEQGSVFTHGDIRQDNIMVDLDRDGGCLITGIIDWEDRGFYPTHYESAQMTRALSTTDEDDWYLYLPSCIAPARFSTRWLVDRLWDIHVRTA